LERLQQNIVARQERRIGEPEFDIGLAVTLHISVEDPGVVAPLAGSREVRRPNEVEGLGSISLTGNWTDLQLAMLKVKSSVRAQQNACTRHSQWIFPSGSATEDRFDSLCTRKPSGTSHFSLLTDQWTNEADQTLRLNCWQGSSWAPRAILERTNWCRARHVPQQPWMVLASAGTVMSPGLPYRSPLPPPL
jgi:hypothetical protein